jgi:hypothetical protein
VLDAEKLPSPFRGIDVMSQIAADGKSIYVMASTDACTNDYTTVAILQVPYRWYGNARGGAHRSSARGVLGGSGAAVAPQRRSRDFQLLAFVTGRLLNVTSDGGVTGGERSWSSLR